MTEPTSIELIVRDALHQFIVESDNRLAFRFLLDKLIEFTNSEYGFIGEVQQNSDGSKSLHVNSFTDISWDAATRESLATNGLLSDNMGTLFGLSLIHI